MGSKTSQTGKLVDIYKGDIYRDRYGNIVQVNKIEGFEYNDTVWLDILYIVPEESIYFKDARFTVGYGNIYHQGLTEISKEELKVLKLELL